jgi:hypothetical protein
MSLKNPYNETNIQASFGEFKTPFQQSEPNRTFRKNINQTSDSILDFKHEVFVIFKRWESCVQCKYAIFGSRKDKSNDENEDQKNNEFEDPTPKIDLPKSGVYQCPHINKDEYEALIIRLRNNPKQYESIKCSPTTLKDGSIQVEVLWAERNIPSSTPNR